MTDWRIQTLDGDPDRVATLLPGGGYSYVAPLLACARAALVDRGWTVRIVEWLGRPGTARGREVYTHVLSDGGGARRPARRLVVGKSLGTLALPEAVRQGLPGAWLTPVLNGPEAPEIAEHVPLLTAPSLLVGGTADSYWDGAIARTSGATVLEIEGADHSLEVPPGWRRSLEVLAQVTEAIEHLAERVETAP